MFLAFDSYAHVDLSTRGISTALTCTDCCFSLCEFLTHELSWDYRQHDWIDFRDGALCKGQSCIRYNAVFFFSWRSLWTRLHAVDFSCHCCSCTDLHLAAHHLIFLDCLSLLHFDRLSSASFVSRDSSTLSWSTSLRCDALACAVQSRWTSTSRPPPAGFSLQHRHSACISPWSLRRFFFSTVCEQDQKPMLPWIRVALECEVSCNV